MTGIDASHGRALLLALMGLALIACQRDPTGRDGSLRAREFEDIIVELRTAERELQREHEAHRPPGELEDHFAQRRAEILERHGATEDDLLDFIERHHAHPGLMADIWERIAERLRTRPDEPARGPSPEPFPDEPIPPLEVPW
jgi:hypothetical protein